MFVFCSPLVRVPFVFCVSCVLVLLSFCHVRPFCFVPLCSPISSVFNVYMNVAYIFLMIFLYVLFCEYRRHVLSKRWRSENKEEEVEVGAVIVIV